MAPQPGSTWLCREEDSEPLSGSAVKDTAALHRHRCVSQPGAQRSSIPILWTHSWSKVQVGQNYLAPKPRWKNNGCLSSPTVKPDPPKNLQVKPLENSRQVEVSWEYPDTWSTPHSYFSLTFSLQVQGKNKREKVRCDSGAMYSVVRFVQTQSGKRWMVITASVYLVLSLCLKLC